MGLLALLDRFTEFFFPQISAKHSPRHPHGLNTRSSEQGADVWVVIGVVAACMSVAIAIIGLHRSNRVAFMSRSENHVVEPSNTSNVNMAVASTHENAPALPPVALDRQHLPITLYPAAPHRQFMAPVRSLLHEPARPDPVFSSEFPPRIGGVATWPAYKRPI